RQPGRDVLGTHAVEEDVRPDHAPLRKRQHPPDHERPQIALTLGDDKLDHGNLPENACTNGTTMAPNARGGSAVTRHASSQPHPAPGVRHRNAVTLSSVASG